MGTKATSTKTDELLGKKPAPGEPKAHPAAEHFPPMDDARFDELVASLRRDGQIDPIIMLDGMILDGRHRWRACAVVGMTPRIEDFTGDNPFDFVESKNIERRDLDPFQRAAIRLLIHSDSSAWEQKQRERDANKKRSDATRRQPRENNRLSSGSGSHDPLSDDNHAKQRHGDRHVESPTARRAAELAEASPDLLRRVAAGKIKGMQALREVKRATLSTRIAALPAGKHRVIYADPPWKYGDERAGLEKEGTAAAAQYPTMPTSDICALDIKSIAADDAVLFMWATFPLLEDALRVIGAWGFDYKTAFVWDKQRSNIGNYHDARAELLMIAVRGSCPIEIDTRLKQVQSIARGKHSEKPEEFRALIDKMYPSGPRVELFRRGEAPAGWVVWGNEVESAS